MPTSTEVALPDKNTCLALYRQMLLIRRCEEQLARSYQAGLIPVACHTYVGEEAIATGVLALISTTTTRSLARIARHGPPSPKAYRPRS